MQRAVILILVMALIGIGAGVWMESSLRSTCQQYLDEAQAVRQLVEVEAWPEALQRQAYLYASWQGEAQRLNGLVSHHHTREVDEALLCLTTALEEGWRKEALLALDGLCFSLDDLITDMSLRWENVL